MKPSREDRFTYTTNQDLLFENLKPLKARVEVRVGSYSRGPLGYTEGGGTCGGSGECRAWDPEGILDCHFVWGFRPEKPNISLISVTSDYTAGQIIKHRRK